MAKEAHLQTIGKHGKIWAKAKVKLKKIFEDKDITRCELCNSNFGLTWAHRRKRVEYYTEPEKLYDFNEVLLICLSDHIKLEKDKDLTRETFKRLRGR